MVTRQSPSHGVVLHDCSRFHVRLLFLGASSRLQQNRLGHHSLLSLDLYDDLLLSIAPSFDWSYTKPPQVDSVPN